MGSSKKVTVGYKYYLGMHMVICHGPVDKLIQINVDNRQAWVGEIEDGQIDIDSDNLFGGEDREGGINGLVDFAPGGSSQIENDYLQAQLGDEIPAFRGVAAAILRQVYLGLNPYLKPWAFRCQRIHKTTDGATQWYDAKAQVGEYGGNYVAKNSGGWKYYETSRADDTDYSSPSFDDSAWPSGTMPFADRTMYDEVLQYGFNTTVGTSIPSEGRQWYRTTFTVDKKFDAVLEIYADNQAWVYVNGYFVLFTGSLEAEEAVVSFYAKTIIPKNLLVNGTNTVAIKHDDGDDGPGFDNYAYFNIGFTSPLSGDMNPAHIIRECLTDPDWGLGYQAADIDDTVFMACADTLYDEQMGISLLWDRQMRIEEFIMEILRHINAALYVSRSTGKFVLKLIRDDYSLSDLVSLDEESIVRVENIDRPSFGELVNSVTVNYWDKDTDGNGSITVQDQALLQMQGVTINTTVQYPGFTNGGLASQVALRNLRAFSSPLLTATIYTNRLAASLNIGDVFLFSWPDHDIYNLVMRVQSIGLGDGLSNQIKISALEDVFAFPDQPVVLQPENEWNDVSTPPLPADEQVALEVPYFELVQILGQTEADSILTDTPESGYLMVGASQPTSAINAVLTVNAGAGYQQSDTFDFSPVAVNSESCNRNATIITYEQGQNLDLVTLGTYVLWGTEIVRIDEVNSDDSQPNFVVGRGCLDTVPVDHNAGETLFFIDEYYGTDNTEYVDGESIDAKVLPTTGLGSLPLNSALALSVTFDSRAYRPYPPGNLTINTEYFPEYIGGTDGVALAWAHRDRLQQTSGTIYDFLYSNIGPEADVTYHLSIYDENDNLLREVGDITTTSYDYTTTLELTDESGVVEDTYWNEVTLLLNCNGADGSTTFTDSSTEGHSVSRVGNTQIDDSQFKFGGGSALFDGTNDYLSIAFDSTLNFVGVDFTVEAWVRSAVSSGFRVIFDFRGSAASFSASWSLYTDMSNGSILIFDGVAGSDVLSSAGGALTQDTWHHVAVESVSGVISIAVDGVIVDSDTHSLPATHSTGLRIGINHGLAGDWSGWMDDIRFTKGSARYGGVDFTPPVYELGQYVPVSDVRLNGRLRFELESVRDDPADSSGIVSFQKHNVEVLREGYGFNYGYFYGGGG